MRPEKLGGNLAAGDDRPSGAISAGIENWFPTSLALLFLRYPGLAKGCSGENILTSVKRYLNNIDSVLS